MDINWYFAFPAVALISACIIGAIQSRGMLPTMTARILLGIAWLIAVISSAAYLVETAPFKHRLIVGALVGIPFGLALILFEYWMMRTVKKQEPLLPQKQEEIAKEIPLERPNIAISLVIDEVSKRKTDYHIQLENIGKLVVKNIRVWLDVDENKRTEIKSGMTRMLSPGDKLSISPTVGFQIEQKRLTKVIVKIFYVAEYNSLFSKFSDI